MQDVNDWINRLHIHRILVQQLILAYFIDNGRYFNTEFNFSKCFFGTLTGRINEGHMLHELDICSSVDLRSAFRSVYFSSYTFH